MRVGEAISTFRGHRAPHLRIIPRWKWWFLLSGFFVALSLLGLFVRGLNYSIDFKGGAQLKYPDHTGVTADQVQSVLGRFGRKDAQVQVVAGKGGSLITVRTQSLNSLGGAPQTQFTFPNQKGVSVDQIRATLAAFGLGKAAIVGGANEVRATTEPISSLAGSRDVVLVYRPKKPLTVADVKKTLEQVSRAGASVTVASGTVAILTRPLEPVPAATSSPTPSSSSSAKASPTPSAAGSVPTPSPSVSPAPTAAEIEKALADQAGIAPGDITVRKVSSVTRSDIVGGLASQAGVQAGQVKVKSLGGDERARLLKTLALQAGVGTAQINIEDFSPTWGTQISQKALQGLIIFLIGVSLYIAWRFEWKMAASALTALAHDLIITVGIYALVGREVTPASVIAVLTILGYSLYDTVVIFDRIRENIPIMRRSSFATITNVSLWETIRRSLATSFITLLPVGALLLFGGDTLKDFAFALFVGVASGTYSSVFIASPMLALLKEREPRYQQIRTRALRAARTKPALQAVPAGARAGVSTIPAGDGEAEPRAVSTGAARRPSSGGGRPSGSKSRGKGKKKTRATPAAKRRRR